ncbi:MAG TPA: nuclear transport factor 2 family protein [Candidatus Saccharimonadales bacterium]|nr:nuclear transport factor 2 family protein [Candidatus Saccharimonadales bacterium]
MDDSHQVIAAYWAAAEARDWPKFAALVAPNVVYEAPQTRERVRGRDAYVRFNAEGFPGDWHLRVERIVAEGRHAASWTQFSEADDEYPGLCFFDLDEKGSIARIIDFWPTPHDLPVTRTHLVERF